MTTSIRGEFLAFFEASSGKLLRSFTVHGLTIREYESRDADRKFLERKDQSLFALELSSSYFSDGKPLGSIISCLQRSFGYWERCRYGLDFLFASAQVWFD